MLVTRNVYVLTDGNTRITVHCLYNFSTLEQYQSNTNHKDEYMYTYV